MKSPLDRCLAGLIPIFLGALASSSSAELPQPLTGVFEWQVSADGGATWTSSITVNPGDPYKIRARAGWTDGPLPSVGFSLAYFEQIDLIGADLTDVFGGASGPGGMPTYTTRVQALPTSWSLQAGTGASAGGLKIDDATAPQTRRLEMNQLPAYLLGGLPNPYFVPANPITLLNLDAVAGAPKTLTISSTWFRQGSPFTNEFKTYVTITGTALKPIQEAIRTDAHVWIRPNADCVPDFNGDGLVDFSDYLEFLSFFDALDFRADLNRDGVVDFPDYLDFLTAYDAGC